MLNLIIIWKLSHQLLAVPTTASSNMHEKDKYIRLHQSVECTPAHVNHQLYYSSAAEQALQVVSATCIVSSTGSRDRSRLTELFMTGETERYGIASNVIVNAVIGRNSVFIRIANNFQ